MDILTAAAFLTTKVTKGAKEDDGKLLLVLKYHRSSVELSLLLDGRQGVALGVFADASHGVNALLAQMSSTPLQGELFRVKRTKIFGYNVVYCIENVEL